MQLMHDVEHIQIVIVVTFPHDLLSSMYELIPFIHNQLTQTILCQET